MNKALVFGSVGLGVGGAVTAISYTSLNLFEKKDLIEELKLLKEQIEKSLEKIKNQIKNHNSVNELQKLLNDLIWIENAAFDLNFSLQMLEDSKSEILLLKQKIESENQDKNEIKNIFKDMEFFSLLIRRMNEKINQLKKQEEAKWEKFGEIKEKLQKYLEDYKKNDSEKSKSLLDFIIYVRDRILKVQYLLDDENLDNLKEKFLIKVIESEQKLKDLISKSESFKNIKKDLEAFLNLSIEFKKLSVFSEFFNNFLSH